GRLGRLDVGARNFVLPGLSGGDAGKGDPGHGPCKAPNGLAFRQVARTYTVAGMPLVQAAVNTQRVHLALDILQGYLSKGPIGWWAGSLHFAGVRGRPGALPGSATADW